MNSTSAEDLKLAKIAEYNHSATNEGIPLMKGGSYTLAIENFTKAIVGITEIFSESPDLKEFKVEGGLPILSVLPIILALRGMAFYRSGNMESALEDFDRATKFPKDCYEEGNLEATMQNRDTVAKNLLARMTQPESKVSEKVEAPLESKVSVKEQKPQKKWWEIWK